MSQPRESHRGYHPINPGDYDGGNGAGAIWDCETMMCCLDEGPGVNRRPHLSSSGSARGRCL